METDMSGSGATPVPNAFIDRFMPAADPASVVVYILGRRRPGISLSETAGLLNMPENRVAAAWDYWEAAGLAKITGGFVKLIDPWDDREIKTRPSYSAEEIGVFSDENEDIRALFRMAEKKLGKPLKYGEMNLFLGFYDWLRLPCDVIERLLDYCAGNGNYSNRYIEKVALDWAENGVTTLEAAEERLNKFGAFRQVMNAFGLPFSRNPIKKETEYMSKWLGEYGFPLEIISIAAERTVMQTGQAKFSYADKILKGWFGRGVKSESDIERADSEFAAEKTEKPKKTSKPPKRKFNNFEGRDWDEAKIGDMMRLEYERLNQKFNSSGDMEG